MLALLGCNASPAGALRSWEGRDDFDPSKSVSAVKVDWRSKTEELVVSLDAEGKGEFSLSLIHI